MSEINSIANGTFTIGQTSATNFVAGNGIKIDEPSAGTVRIGTDEKLYRGYTSFADPVFKSMVNTGYYVTEVYAQRVGNTVTFYGQFNPMNKHSISSGTWVKLCDVNDELKPTYTTDFSFTCYESPGVYGSFRINANGEFLINQFGTTGGSWGRIFNATYNINRVSGN